MTDPLPPERSRAVLIGFSHYRHLTAIPAVANNLTGIASALQDRWLWGLPPDRCTVVTQNGDDEVSVKDVLDAVSDAASGVDDGGLLFVYYAGHGLLDDLGHLYLAVPGSEQCEEDATAVAYESIRRRVRRGGARRLVVLDCCFAGRALDSGMSATTVLEDLEIEQAAALVATGRTAAALAPPGERYTAFTGVLLGVVNDGICDGPEALDTRTIWRATRRELAAKSRPLPEFRECNAAGEVPFVRNAWHKRGLPKAVQAEIRDGNGSVSRVADVLGFLDVEAMSAETAATLVGFLAEVAAADRHPDRDEAELLLVRHWSPVTPEILAARAASAPDVNQLRTWLTLAAASARFSDSPLEVVVGTFLKRLIRRKVAPDALAAALVHLPSELADTAQQIATRLSPRIGLWIVIVLVRKIFDNGLVEQPSGGGWEPTRQAVSRYLQGLAIRDRQAWAAPLMVASGAGPPPITPDHLAALTAVDRNAWAVVLWTAVLFDHADLVFPALLPTLVAAARSGRSGLSEALEHSRLTRPANQANRDLLRLLLQTGAQLTPRLEEPEYVEALVAAWRSPEFEPDRAALAGGLAATLPVAPPFEKVDAVAVALGKEVRGCYVEILAVALRRDRALARHLRTAQPLAQEIGALPDLAWVVALVRLAEIADDPNTTPAALAQAFLAGAEGGVRPRELVLAVVPWLDPDRPHWALLLRQKLIETNRSRYQGRHSTPIRALFQELLTGGLGNELRDRVVALLRTQRQRLDREAAAVDQLLGIAAEPEPSRPDRPGRRPSTSDSRARQYSAAAGFGRGRRTGRDSRLARLGSGFGRWSRTPTARVWLGFVLFAALIAVIGLVLPNAQTAGGSAAPHRTGSPVAPTSTPSGSWFTPPAPTGNLIVDFEPEVLLPQLPAGKVSYGSSQYLVPAVIHDLYAFFAAHWRKDKSSTPPVGKIIVVYSQPYDTGCSTSASGGTASPIVIPSSDNASWYCFDRRSGSGQNTVVLPAAMVVGEPALVAFKIADIFALFVASKLNIPDQETRWRVGACVSGMWVASLARSGRLSGAQLDAFLDAYDSRYRDLAERNADSLSGCLTMATDPSPSTASSASGSASATM